MAPCGFTSGHSYKHWLIILWQEAVEAAGLIQHDSSCQYMIKYRATLLIEHLTHPTFSLNQSCPAGVFQKERPIDQRARWNLLKGLAGKGRIERDRVSK